MVQGCVCAAVVWEAKGGRNQSHLNPDDSVIPLSRCSGFSTRFQCVFEVGGLPGPEQSSGRRLDTGALVCHL